MPKVDVRKKENVPLFPVLAFCFAFLFAKQERGFKDRTVWGVPLSACIGPLQAQQRSDWLHHCFWNQHQHSRRAVVGKTFARFFPMQSRKPTIQVVLATALATGNAAVANDIES